MEFDFSLLLKADLYNKNLGLFISPLLATIAL